MKFILWILEKLGRRYALLDFYGDVHLHRYFVLYKEEFFDNRWLAKLPNLFVHVYPGEPGGWGPDGPTPHSHPWDTLGVVVRGEYTEIINETETRITKALGISYTPHTSHHRIPYVAAGTTSLFFHGFRKKEWGLHGYKHKIICNECKEFNNGVCMSEVGNMPFNPQLDSKLGVKGWRTMKLVKVDKDFDNIIIDRKASLKRMGIKTPATSMEKLRLDRIMKLKVKNNAEKAI